MKNPKLYDKLDVAASALLVIVVESFLIKEAYGKVELMEGVLWLISGVIPISLFFIVRQYAYVLGLKNSRV